MTWKVEWFYEAIEKWMYLDSYFFRRSALRQINKRLFDKNCAGRWRLSRMDDWKVMEEYLITRTYTKEPQP